MKLMRNKLFAVLIAIVAGAALWLVMSRRPESAAEGVPVRPSSQAATPASVTSTDKETSSAAPETIAAPASAPAEIPAAAVLPKPKPRVLAAMEEIPAGPEMEGTPGLSPLTVLENLRSVFHQYNARFGGNPIGTNPEITASLNGKNPRQVVFVNPEDGLRINDRGQLVDNWGTPFFFHQLSRIEMEIRSAGPDRRMWTTDDLVIK